MKFNKILFSIKTSIILLILYSVLLAIATFIEKDYGTTVSRYYVYNSRFFDLLNIFLIINGIGILFKYKTFNLKKLTVAIFHLGFVVIIIGAGITRFYGEEGILHLREGEEKDYFLSQKTYVNVNFYDAEYVYQNSFPVEFNYLSYNDFERTADFNGNKFKIKLKKIIPNAVEQIVEDANGFPILDFTYIEDKNAQEFYIKQGETKEMLQNSFSFNDKQNSDINFKINNNKFYIKSRFQIFYSSMLDSTKGFFKPDTVFELKNNTLYRWNNSSLVLNVKFIKAKIELKSSKKENLDALFLDVTNNNKTKEIIIFGKKSIAGNEEYLTFGKNKISLSYGAKQIKLPFSIRLNDFELTRYPGSKSPSSYKSKVTLIDKSKNFSKDYQIYMNHILSYGGYRFFQSSYDPDELGSIISVNRDFWGTLLTYIGYSLLFIGMFLSLFNRNSRFRTLLKKINTKTIIIILFFSVLSQNVFSQDIPEINKAHADKFGELYVLDFGGRIKPVNTLTSQILRKLTHRTTFNGLTSDQFYLSLILYPEQWADVPLIKVTNPVIITEFNIKDKHISLNNLYKNNVYRLQDAVNRAYAKNPGERNQYDRDIIKLDDDVNVLYMAINNEYLKIFPLKNSDKWLSVSELDTNKKSNEYKLFNNYLLSLKKAVSTKSWNNVDENLNKIKNYQQQNANKNLLNETKLKTEIFYNKTAIFRHLFELYFILGILYLFFLIFNLIVPKYKLSRIDFIIRLVLYIAFALQTLGLIIRWYISGHAPWSDGYESMIYIAWATQFAGIFFSRKNKLALASTTLLAGIILLVSHLSWINPEITNLVPVLKSFWLTIHVAIITGSYGFLGMSAILGFVALILMSLKNKKNVILLDKNIKQITYINEMSLIIGLYMLTIGTFLGGVWANESWGRYWGWDPKETWALISVLVYAIVSHFRLIPRLNNRFIFNLSSLLAFGSIIMTYFGVNFYLSGLHSYAKGEPVPIPVFIYYILAALLFLATYAYHNNKRYKI